MIRITTIIAILILLTGSCELAPMQRFGFDSQYGETSTGLTIFSVSNSTDQVFLTGSIIVTEGKLTTELITPSGEIVYYDTVFAPDTLKIGRSFVAEPGVWKLKYTSLEGTGIITLHAVLLEQ